MAINHALVARSSKTVPEIIFVLAAQVPEVEFRIDFRCLEMNRKGRNLLLPSGIEAVDRKKAKEDGEDINEH